MIVQSATGHELSMRSSSLVYDWPLGASLPEGLFSGGGLMPLERAVGLPALLACLFRIGDGIGLMPQIVYRGKSANRGARERAADSWQWRLLHERPNLESPGPAAFRGDIAVSIRASGNAYLRKYTGSSGKVVELIPIDATKVKPRRQGGTVVFEDRTEGQCVTRSRREILHVRGVALRGQLEGVSPITAARLTIANGLRRQLFEDRYYANDARPGLALKFPQGMQFEQARTWLDTWNSEHQGLEHAHKAAALPGGADVTQIPISLEDSQFVESHRLTIEQLAGLFGIPLPFVFGGGDQGRALTEQDRMQLVTFGLGPIYTVIDQAFTADETLFPPDSRTGTSDLFCEHLADALLRPDTLNRYQAYKAARQAGWLTANEIRALENYPPIEGGDVLQVTPVGGAPNSEEEAKQLLVDLVDYFQLADPGKQDILARATARAGLAHTNGNGDPLAALTA